MKSENPSTTTSHYCVWFVSGTVITFDKHGQDALRRYKAVFGYAA